MKEMVYTLAAWRVQAGRHQAFISAWKNLGAAFNALSDPPVKGVLIQSTSDPRCSTHLFHGIAWKRCKPCETTIMPGRESKDSRDYARRPPRGRFTSSPNRPSSAHRQADSDTIKRQCSILTRHCTRPPAACESRQFSRFQDALAAGAMAPLGRTEDTSQSLSAQKRCQRKFA
jgi:hypothetical protein